MTTDPGDLVLDPTCGSGTTAFVAEQWGRRWVTIDTSRIALNIAKTRLLTATFPYYRLHDEGNGDIRQGFTYEKVPHVTLKSIANAETADDETLFDQPEVDKKKLRVSGPFTVETLQNFEPVAPEELDKEVPDKDELENFEERIFEHMKSAGIKNGIRNEQAVFTRVDRLNSGYLHAEGFYNAAKGEKKAYIHIGPKFGTVSRQAVNEAVKECRKRGDADWLIVLGFSFESNIENQNVTTSMGSFEVTKVRMHDDLMQDGLLKRDKKAASFVTIGEPDIKLAKQGKAVAVEIRGLDIYDPVTDEVKARDVADIAYWMVDDDYDGSNFIVRQVFFCGGDKDEFAKWQRGLSDLAMTSAKRQAEKTLKIEIDDDAFARLYGHKSHAIEIKKKGQKIAVRVISQFGEKCTKVLET
jgi:adenine-specific DNA-methyltransferase